MDKKKKKMEITLRLFSIIADCIREINNCPGDNIKDLDVVVPMYKLTEYSNNNAKYEEV